MSAMFLAQVEIEEDKAKDGNEGGGEESKEGKQKKGFLQGSKL